jgi:predicted RNA-binding protein (virulence factor B family)
MLQIGNYNNLEITRITASGAVFKTNDGDVLLPLRLVPQGAEAGALLEVFVYVDSDGRLTATTKRPRAVVGDFAFLKVKEATTVGSFLDWGLEKDLLLPFGEQIDPVRRGDQVLVRVFLHSSGRIAASARLDKFIEPADDSLAEGMEVDLLVHAHTDLGAKVIINKRFGGLIFHTELVVKPVIGERLRGYVKKIREDGKIDVTLRKGGILEAAHDHDIILAALKAHGGFLPLTDKSPPEEIAKILRLSKKSFKRAVGGLYKDGAVSMEPGGIRIKNRGGTLSKGNNDGA